MGRESGARVERQSRDAMRDRCHAILPIGVWATGKVGTEIEAALGRADSASDLPLVSSSHSVFLHVFVSFVVRRAHRAGPLME